MLPKQRIVLTSLLGVMLGSFGLIYVLSLERLQRHMLEWFMVLRPNSMITDLWENPSIDIKVDLFIFNWTNAHQYRNPHVKPHFVEHGPYSFTEKMQKFNIVWHEENSTVSYWRRSLFYFNAADSVGRLEDVIVAPNALAAGLYRKSQYWGNMVRSLMDIALKAYNGITLVRPAGDWMFNGFDTPLIKMSKLVPTSIVPEKLYFPYERIGYGYPRNGSMEIYGHHNVYTGRNDFSKLGQIASWRYNNISNAFPSCGRIRGSTGEFHPIPLQPGKPIVYFLPDLCRDLEVEYAGTTVFEGIEAFLYKGTVMTMAKGRNNSRHRCHCTADCEEVPTGVLNISSCWYDVPVFASSPHFYGADPYYAAQIDGMKPDKERHEMTIILEPKTGMLLDLKARLMVSLLIEPWQHSSLYRNVPGRTFFPLIWVDYQARITPDLLYYLKFLPLSMLLGKIFGMLCVAIGLLLFLWYPRQVYLKKQHMRNIEISSLDSGQPPSSSVCTEPTKSDPEVSPLLIGISYVPKESATRAS